MWADIKNQFITHTFKKIELELKDGKWKKKPVSMTPEWSKLEKSISKKGDKGVALLTGKKTGILVLDFDKRELFNEYNELYNFYDYPIVKTRNGFHVYFKWDDKYDALPNNLDKIDIQGNGKQVFYDGTIYETETGDLFTYKFINEPDELLDMPNELFYYLKSFNKKTKPIKECEFSIPCDDKLWKDIIENINIKYINGYTSWFQIVCGIYSIGKESNNLDTYKETARVLSMKSPKYDKSHKEFEKIWEDCSKYSYTGGSVRHYSRLSNENKYLDICKKKVGKDALFYAFDEKLLCDYFLESYGDNLICNYNKIYIYFNGIWTEDNKGIIIQKFLRQEIQTLYKRIIDNLNKLLQTTDADCETITKNIKECSKVLTNYGNQKNKNVWGLIYCELITKNINNEIFDTKKNLFCFTNKAYDLTNNTWITINKFDYILTTCGKDFIEPTKDQIDKVKSILKDIFPNEDYKKAYISVLKTGLTGNRPEKFIVATGEGRNGKGLLNDLFQHLLGDYYGILHLQLLTKELKSGANTELRNIHKKRFLKATEPDSGSNEKLRMSNIKALTGESTLKARGLYENNFDIQIEATEILECNKLPFISADGCEAEKQRMVIIPFETTFTDDKKDIQNNPNKYKPKDDVLKSKTFQEEHYSALFMYLINNHEGLELYIPDSCKRLALSWILDKDDFYGWFCEHYMESPDDVVSVKDVYKHFKHSDYFMRLSARDKKNTNEKSFKESIQTKLKHLYINHNEMFNGKRITKESIKGFIKKPDEDSD